MCSLCYIAAPAEGMIVRSAQGRGVRNMKILFLDDSKQRDCPRDGVGDIVGVGGVIVPGDDLRKLEAALKQVLR